MNVRMIAWILMIMGIAGIIFAVADFKIGIGRNFALNLVAQSTAIVKTGNVKTDNFTGMLVGILGASILCGGFGFLLFIDGDPNKKALVA